MIQLILVSVRYTPAMFGKTCVTIADDFPVGLDTQASASIILKDKVDNAFISLDDQQVAECVKGN